MREKLRAMHWLYRLLERRSGTVRSKNLVEILCRNVVSRGYYFVFIYARTLFEEVERKGNASFSRKNYRNKVNWHKYIPAYFSDQRKDVQNLQGIIIDPEKKLGMTEEKRQLFYEIMKVLRVTRNKADYDYEETFTEKEKDEILHRIEEIYNMLKEVENYVN